MGVVGGTTALSGLVINVADVAADTGDITIAGIGDDDPAQGVVGNVTLGNANTDLLTFSGTNYDIDGTTVVFETEAAADRIKITGGTVNITNNGKNIHFDSGSILLSGAGTTTISTGTGAGNIQIDGAIDGTSGQTENLVIESGTGSTTVDGAIGAVNKVGTITIGSGNNGTIEVSSIGAADSSGASGAVNIGNTATATLTLDGTIYETTSSQKYSAATGGFNIVVNPGNTTAVEFATAGGDVEFDTSGVSLSGDSTHTIDTGTGGGLVTFDGAIQSGDDGDDDVLVIKSGTGDVTITGAIGASKELGGLKINDGSGTNTASEGNANITITGAIGSGGAGVKGDTLIGNTSTQTVNFGGALYSFDGTNNTITSASGDNINVAVTAEFETAADAITFATGNIDLANGANLTVNSDGGVITIAGISGHSSETVTINANDTTGADPNPANEKVVLGNVGDSGHAGINTVTVSGDDGITLNGAIYTDGTAAAGTVTLNDAVTIDGDVTIDTDDSSTDGNIVFTASIDGKSGGSTDTLTLEGGTGTITLQPIGATNPLGSLTINSQTTGTAALSIPNIGSGTVDAATVVGITGATSIGNTSGGVVTLSGTIYKTGSGAFSITTSGGTNTTDKEIVFSGANPIISTAAGSVSLLGGEIDIQNGTLTINTNTANAATNGGDITIAKTVYGASDETLTLDAHTGTGSAISVGPIGAAGASQIAGINMTAGGGITLNGNIETSNAGTGIDFNSPVIIADNTSITITTDAGGTDGAVVFDSTISGTGATNAQLANAENLTIDSGTGNVTITGNIGETTATALGSLTINTTNGGTEDGDITLSGDIGASSEGSVTAVGTTGTVTIGNANTRLLTLGGAVYNTNQATYELSLIHI